MWLDIESTANVTITITSNNADITTQPASLTFIPSDWQTRQAVTVRAAQDEDQDNSATISHAVSGGNYDGVTADPVAVAVTYDDTNRAVLRHFYQSTGGVNWTNNANGRVTHLELRNNNLFGEIPPLLGRMGKLESWRWIATA